MHSNWTCLKFCLGKGKIGECQESVFCLLSVKSSSMPFSLDELVNMMITLRDVCLGIVELAHPDAKPTVNEDYRIALNRTGGKTRNNNVKDTTKETAQWSYLFKVWRTVFLYFELLWDI